MGERDFMIPFVALSMKSNVGFRKKSFFAMVILLVKSSVIRSSFVSTRLSNFLQLESTFLFSARTYRTRSSACEDILATKPKFNCHKNNNVFTRSYHSSTNLFLNRFLFETDEITLHGNIEDEIGSNPPSVTLCKDDYRTVHAAKILQLENGDKIRAGILIDDFGDLDDNETSLTPKEVALCGMITDEAEISWLPENEMKKVKPKKNGDPPGSLHIILHSLSRVTSRKSDQIDDMTSSVSLILALPRPLALARILPMIGQIGVSHLILTSARKVPKDYFGSHLFRKPNELRKLLIEGLCQSGDVRIPKVTVVRHLKPFLDEKLDTMFPKDEWARAIAHPQRLETDSLPCRLRDVTFPDTLFSEGKLNRQPKIVLAVGPEGGWTEPEELDYYQDCGFQQITLGTRILRSDVAVISLLSLAHDVCSSKISKP